MNEIRKPNGPTGREWGEFTAMLRVLGDKVDRMHDAMEKRDDKLDSLKDTVSTIKARLFALGAAIAAASFVGGGITYKELSEVALREIRYERPYQKSQESRDLAFNHCAVRARGSGACEVRE